MPWLRLVDWVTRYPSLIVELGCLAESGLLPRAVLREPEWAQPSAFSTWTYLAIDEDEYTVNRVRMGELLPTPAFEPTMANMATIGHLLKIATVASSMKARAQQSDNRSMREKWGKNAVDPHS